MIPTGPRVSVSLSVGKSVGLSAELEWGWRGNNKTKLLPRVLCDRDWRDFGAKSHSRMKKKKKRNIKKLAPEKKDEVNKYK